MADDQGTHGKKDMDKNCGLNNSLLQAEEAAAGNQEVAPPANHSESAAREENPPPEQSAARRRAIALALLRIRGEMEGMFRESKKKLIQWDEAANRLMAETGKKLTAKQAERKFNDIVRYHRNGNGAGPYAQAVADVLQIMEAAPAPPGQVEVAGALKLMEILCTNPVDDSNNLLNGGYRFAARSVYDPETDQDNLIPVLASVSENLV